MSEPAADLELRTKLGIYEVFAATGRRPSLDEIAARVGAPRQDVREAFGRLRAGRVLVLEADGESIRMAPPFSGVATQHRVSSRGVEYHANCAWDAFGIAAALRRASTVRSRCEQSREPLVLELGEQGPPACDWRFHSAVPAARWWEDIVFT
jgi:hypothetical protein